MSLPPNDPFRAPGPEINPYAAPEAGLGEVPVAEGRLGEAEAVRRAHLNHEASVRAIGVLSIAWGALVLLTAGLVTFAVLVPSRGRGAQGPAIVGGVVLVMIYVIWSVLSFAIGFGLRALQTWARWTSVAILTVFLLLMVVGILAGAASDGNAGADLAAGSVLLLITAYILYLLVAPKAAVIFSPGYKDVMAMTPHIKYQMSWIVKGCLVVFVAIILLMVAAALITWLSGAR